MFPSWSQQKVQLLHVASTDSSRRISKRLLAELELLSEPIEDDHIDHPDIRVQEIDPPSVDISIIVDDHLRDQDLEASFSVLTAQLNRAKGHLLDVFWRFDVQSPQHNLIVQFIRDNAPFHRWRSATIAIDYYPYPYYADRDVASSKDVFTNLERLAVKRLGGAGLPKLFANIESAPKLQSLDLSAADTGSSSRGVDGFTSLIRQVSHLTLPTREAQYMGYRLSANITHLTARESSEHNYLHIRSYNLFKCKFEPTKTIDLRSLTTFVVGSIEVGCKVILPVLQDMEFRELKLHEEAVLDVPFLKNLRVIANADTIDYGYQSSFSRVMRHPGYKIWPSKTISVAIFLSITDIITLITRHPDIETTIFGFKEPFVAEQMLDFLAGLHHNQEVHMATNTQDMCGSLKEVGLRFEWPISNTALWKECASRLLSNRTKLRSLVSVWTSSKECHLPLIYNGHLVYGGHSDDSSDAQAVQLPICWIKLISVKVLLNIFDFCEPKVQARLVLTHTCRRWMKIAEAVPYLWASIMIHCRLSDSGFKSSLSLLTMQLIRAKENLLDVCWIHHAQSPRNDIIDKFIHENAPFKRWRTLSVEVHGMDPLHPKTGWPRNAFIKLEALKIKYGRISLPLSIITNLQMLDLAGGQGLAYLPSLRHSSNIILPGYENFHQLPSNIIHLRVTSRSEHIFPDLLCYDLFSCKFESPKSIDLWNLSTFITDSIEVVCHVTLPALRNIEFRVLKFHEDASLEAPYLENLRIVPDPDTIDFGMGSAFSRAMRHPGYGLWPTKAIYLGTNLSIKEIMTLLTRCRNIEVVSLSFSEPFVAKLMLNMLAGLYPDPPQYMAPNSQGFCSRLKEVSLNFGWRIREVAFWKHHAAHLVKNRLKKLPSVSVYGFWEGENLSVQLL